MKTLNMLLCTIAIIMGTTTYAESKPVTQEPDSLMQVIESRRSIRRYTDEKIDHQTLEYIVKAGAFAPSSYGQNPVEFVVVEDSKTLKAVASAKRIGAPSVNDAAAATVCQQHALADSRHYLWQLFYYVLAKHQASRGHVIKVLHSLCILYLTFFNYHCILPAPRSATTCLCSFLSKTI